MIGHVSKRSAYTQHGACADLVQQALPSRLARMFLEACAWQAGMYSMRHWKLTASWATSCGNMLHCNMLQQTQKPAPCSVQLWLAMQKLPCSLQQACDRRLWQTLVCIYRSSQPSSWQRWWYIVTPTCLWWSLSCTAWQLTWGTPSKRKLLALRRPTPWWLSGSSSMNMQNMQHQMSFTAIYHFWMEVGHCSTLVLAVKTRTTSWCNADDCWEVYEADRVCCSGAAGFKLLVCHFL